MANGCCTTCKTVLTEANCSPSKFKLGYGHCRVCDASRSREAYKRSPKRIRVANCKWHGTSGWKIRYERKYGVPIEEFHKKLIEQSGRCDICNRPMIKPCQDHNHETGEVRGLLCSFCNGLLGRVGESIEILSNTIGYLRKFKGDFMTTH